jgi:hypothetical protein
MSTEDKILYVGLAGMVLGIFFLAKKKPSGKVDEDTNVTRQNCINAGVEKQIPKERMDEFVEDCTKALMEQEAEEIGK